MMLPVWTAVEAVEASAEAAAVPPSPAEDCPSDPPQARVPMARAAAVSRTPVFFKKVLCLF